MVGPPPTGVLHDHLGRPRQPSVYNNPACTTPVAPSKDKVNANGVSDATTSACNAGAVQNSQAADDKGLETLEKKIIEQKIAESRSSKKKVSIIEPSQPADEEEESAPRKSFLDRIFSSAKRLTRAKSEPALDKEDSSFEVKKRACQSTKLPGKATNDVGQNSPKSDEAGQKPNFFSRFIRRLTKWKPKLRNSHSKEARPYKEHDIGTNDAMIQFFHREDEPLLLYENEEVAPPTIADVNEVDKLLKWLLEKKKSMEAVYDFLTTDDKCKAQGGFNRVQLMATLSAIHCPLIHSSRFSVDVTGKKNVSQVPQARGDNSQRQFALMMSVLRLPEDSIMTHELFCNRLPEMIDKERRIVAYLEKMFVGDPIYNAKESRKRIGRFVHLLERGMHNPSEALELLSYIEMCISMEPLRVVNAFLWGVHPPAEQVQKNHSYMDKIHHTDEPHHQNEHSNGRANAYPVKGCIPLAQLLVTHGGTDSEERVAVLLKGWSLCQALVTTAIKAGPRTHPNINGQNQLRPSISGRPSTSGRPGTSGNTGRGYTAERKPSDASLHSIHSFQNGDISPPGHKKGGAGSKYQKNVAPVNGMSGTPKRPMTSPNSPDGGNKKGRRPSRQLDEPKKAPEAEDEATKTRLSCAALWEHMHPRVVLWEIAHGASNLEEDDFHELVGSAWSLLDTAQGADWLTGGIGLRRLRHELDGLKKVRRSFDDLEPAEVMNQLRLVELTLQHLESICQADQKLARGAALYGTAFLVEVAQFSVNHAVDLVDSEEVALRSVRWASRVNRDSENLQKVLLPLTEELLEKPLRAGKLDAALKSQLPTFSANGETEEDSEEKHAQRRVFRKTKSTVTEALKELCTISEEEESRKNSKNSTDKIVDPPENQIKLVEMHIPWSLPCDTD